MSGSTRPLVSIIIPVYNGANFLAEAIESALAQTYRECEIIVVNDGSNDEGQTAAICRRYGPLIRYVEKANGGVSSALNAGISAMRGKYFSWLSHDDLFHPLKTQLQVSVAEHWHGDDIVVFCDYEVFSADKPRRHGVLLDDALVHSGRDGLGWRSLLQGHMNGCGLLIPRHLFDRHGAFDETQRITQDYDYWLRLMETAYFLHTPLKLVSYRLHGEQTTRTASLTEEHEALWPRIAAAVPSAKQVEISGSRYRFFQQMAEFFAERAACPMAARWATEKAASLLLEAPISIVVLGSERRSPDTPAMEIMAAGMQKGIEVLVLQESPDHGLRPGDHIPEEMGAVRNLYIPATQSPQSMLEKVLETITGEYVTFVEAGKAIPCQHLARQIMAMQESGWLACVPTAPGNPDAALPDAFAEIDRNLDITDLSQPSQSAVFHRAAIESCLASSGSQHHQDDTFEATGSIEAGNHSTRLTPESTPADMCMPDMAQLVAEIVRRGVGQTCVTAVQIRASFEKLSERHKVNGLVLAVDPQGLSPNRRAY